MKQLNRSRTPLRTLLTMACMAALPAMADTLAFEDADGTPLTGIVRDGQGFSQGNYMVHGYAFEPSPGSLVGAVIDGASNSGACVALACGAGNPTSYYAALNDGIVEIEHGTAGTAFRLQSFDASYIGNIYLGFQPVAGVLRVQGFRADHSTVWEDFELVGREQDTPGFDFTHFVTSANFAAQQFVTIDFFGFSCNTDGKCSAFDNLRGQFGIDNIALSAVSAVPEPSSWLTFGAGLLAIGRLARRRRPAAMAIGAAA